MNKYRKISKNIRKCYVVKRKFLNKLRRNIQTSILLKKTCKPFWYKYDHTNSKTIKQLLGNNNNNKTKFYYSADGLSLGERVTASLLKSPRLFSVFWPISAMLLFGLSSLVFLFPSLLVLLPVLW